MYRKILLPIDLAEPELTERAIREGGMLARACGSELRLVNVQSLIPIAFLDYVPEDFEPLIRRGLEQEIAAVAARIDYPQELVSTVILFGPVYHKVLAEADEWRADLILICSHRPSMARFLIGSNAQAIVAHAKCSVLVVRP